MVSPNSARQRLNARTISNASLHRGVLNASSRTQGWKTSCLREVWRVSWWLVCARLHYKLASLVWFEPGVWRTAVPLQRSVDSVTRKCFNFTHIQTHIHTHIKIVVFMEWQTIWNSTELPQIFLSLAYWQGSPWFLLLLLTAGANLWLGWVFCRSEPFSVSSACCSCPYQCDPDSRLVLTTAAVQYSARPGIQTRWKGTRGGWGFLSWNLLSRQLWYTFSRLTEEQIPVCSWFFIQSRFSHSRSRAGLCSSVWKHPGPPGVQLPVSWQRRSQDSLLCLCFTNVSSLSQMNVTASSQE